MIGMTGRVFDGARATAARGIYPSHGRLSCVHPRCLSKHNFASKFSLYSLARHWRRGIRWDCLKAALHERTWARDCVLVRRRCPRRHPHPPPSLPPGFPSFPPLPPSADAVDMRETRKLVSASLAIRWLLSFPSSTASLRLATMEGTPTPTHSRHRVRVPLSP